MTRLACRHCDSRNVLPIRYFGTTSRTFLLVGLLFSPLVIGLPLIVMAWSVRDYRHRCRDCGRVF